jgi:hypothetical protein
VAVTQAVANAKNALQGQTGALTDGTGAINLHTAAGAAAWQALTQLKDASNTLISTMQQQGATTADVAKRDGELRDSFIQTARNMGFTAAQADNLANQILGIPGERKTEMEAPGAAGAQTPLRRSPTRSTASRCSARSTSTPSPLRVARRPRARPRRNALYGAAGGIVTPFASGGFQPMQGGVAQVVAPQTFRLIGDRVTDDEAYIPINDSARSLEILAQTASRMGTPSTVEPAVADGRPRSAGSLTLSRRWLPARQSVRSSPSGTRPATSSPSA